MTHYTFPSEWEDRSVILSHDWLTGMRGGERVLELLCNGFPGAPVYTLLHKQGSISNSIASHPIHTSWLQRIPGIGMRYRYFLPLFPQAVQSMRSADADLLISTSHCVAKGLIPRPGTRHLCYCFTPMRYAWTFYDEYFGKNPLKKAALKPTLSTLRRWDRKASDRVDLFVAISEHVKDRIRTYYGREAEVVYPPVDTGRCTPGPRDHEGFDLIVSALVPYKKIDLAVQAYNRLGYPLVIVGTGTEYESLSRAASDNISFFGWKSDEDIVDLYRKCRCLVFPGEEDFGIVPVEAQACGRPVVALGKGGALETVTDNETGIYFHEQTPEALVEAVETCGAREWDPGRIRANAERFSIQHFLDGMENSIRKCLDGPCASSK